MPPRAELALDAVAVGERGGEASDGVAHRFAFVSSSLSQFSTTTIAAALVVVPADQARHDEPSVPRDIPRGVPA